MVFVWVGREPSTAGGLSHSFNSGTEWGPSGIRNLQVSHAEALLLPEKVCREALLCNAPSHLVLHLVQAVGVQLDVFLALVLDLGLPRRKEARDVLKGRIALDGKFPGDAKNIVRKVSMGIDWGSEGWEVLL